MAKKYSRQEMIAYLKGIRAKGEPIVVAGAGSGLTGKSIEAGGADVLMVFNSGKYRMSGHGSLSGWLAFGNANEVAFTMGANEVLPVVKEVPVICSCFGQDVTREISTHLDRVMTENFSGINNFPTMGMVDGQFREQLELTNLGFQKEVDMVRIAREKDIFTIVYVFKPEEAKAMAEAGADCIISHVGQITDRPVPVCKIKNNTIDARGMEMIHQVFREEPKTPCILLEEHGLVAVGKTAMDACYTAELAEENAKVFWAMTRP